MRQERADHVFTSRTGEKDQKKYLLKRGWRGGAIEHAKRKEKFIAATLKGIDQGGT